MSRRVYRTGPAPIFTALCLVILAGLVSPVMASPSSATREEALRNIATNVIAAGWQQVAAACRDLSQSLDQFTRTPTPSSLESARAAWLAAANATSQLRCFQAGPLLERDFTSVFSYWQILPPRVEAVINSSEALDRSLLDRLGATTKGLFAVEFLLFERGDLPPEERSKIPSVLELFAGTNSQRRAAFLLLVAHDVESKASQLAADWSARGDQAAATKFAAGGQDSLNLLVNQLSMGLEYIAEREVNFVLVLPQPLSLQLSRVERSRSGSSLRGALAGIEGARKIYLGGEGLGLDDSLQRLNAPLDQRIKDQFQATLAATSAIGSSLEQAAADHRATVEAAYAKLRELEVLIKVDLASALGVTITFSSNDGD